MQTQTKHKRLFTRTVQLTELANEILFLARPSQLVFQLPLIPWIEQAVSILIIASLCDLNCSLANLGLKGNSFY